MTFYIVANSTELYKIDINSDKIIINIYFIFEYTTLTYLFFYINDN
jgi:hypothetical protein